MRYRPIQGVRPVEEKKVGPRRAREQRACSSCGGTAIDSGDLGNGKRTWDCIDCGLEEPYGDQG